MACTFWQIYLTDKPSPGNAKLVLRCRYIRRVLGAQGLRCVGQTFIVGDFEGLLHGSHRRVEAKGSEGRRSLGRMVREFSTRAVTETTPFCWE